MGAPNLQTLMRRQTTVVALALAFLLGAAVWVWLAGPAVIVRVTTVDASGAVVHAIDDEVRVYSRYGVVSSRTDADGEVVFRLIRWRAGFPPSLGPDSMPEGRSFFVDVRPNLDPPVVCPSYSNHNMRRTARWFWQDVEVSRPPYGILSVDLSGVTVDPVRDYLRIRSAGYSNGSVAASYVGRICVLTDSSLEVSLIVDSKTVYTWPEFVPKAYDTTTLTVPQQ